MKSKPVIVIDNREQTPLPFTNLATMPGSLYSGDYSVKDSECLFSVERKTVADLCGSVTRGRDRFERELHRLRGFQFARLLIVGAEHEVQTVAANPKSVFSSLSAFEVRYNLPVVWSPTPGAAAHQVERWAWFWWRERAKLYQHVPVCDLPNNQPTTNQ